MDSKSYGNYDWLLLVVFWTLLLCCGFEIELIAKIKTCRNYSYKHCYLMYANLKCPKLFICYFLPFILSWKFNKFYLSFNKHSAAVCQLSCNGRERPGELTILFVTRAVTHSGCTPECCRCSCRWGSSQRWPAWWPRHSPARRSGQSVPPQHKSEPVPVGQPQGFSAAMSDWVCWTPTTHLSHSLSQPPVSHQTCRYHP